MFTWPRVSVVFRSLRALAIASDLISFPGLRSVFNLLSGDREERTFLIAGISLLVTIVSSTYLAFARIHTRVLDHRGRPHRDFKFARLIRLSARLVLGVVVVSSIFSAWYIVKTNNDLKSRLVVVVFKFSGEHPERHELGHHLKARLEATLNTDPETRVIGRPRVITEWDGKAMARSAAAHYWGDLVIWGSTDVSTSSAFIRLHVENLLQPPESSLSGSEVIMERLPIGELESFEIHERVSSDLGPLVTFLAGLVNYRSGRYEQAEVLFSQAAHLYRESNTLFNCAPLYFYRGTTLHMLGLPDSALANLDLAITTGERDTLLVAAAYDNRGAALADLGRLEDAISSFTRAIEVDSTSVLARFNRGLAYGNNGDMMRAAGDYNWILARHPDHFPAYYHRGNLCRLSGDYTGAIKDYTIAVTLRPDFYQAYVNRGIAYKQRGLFLEAIRDYSLALQIQPRDELALCNRGSLLLFYKDTTGALADLSQAIEIAPDYANAYMFRERAYLALGDTALASKDRRMLEALGRESGKYERYQRPMKRSEEHW